MRHEEHQEQVALMRWWSLAHSRYHVPEKLLFAVPNGGRRDAVTGARLKAEGVRAGVPDLFLAVPVGPYGGLWLELKAAKGRPSEAQKVMMHLLEASGYAVCVAQGWDAASVAIEKYLGSCARKEEQYAE